MTVRAIRGAIQLERDGKDHPVDATKGLLTTMPGTNGLEQQDLISPVFTATPDPRGEFPVVAAREPGLTDTPLPCARELDVAEALPRVVRILAHAGTGRPECDVRHVRPGGAEALRTDLNGPLEETR